MASTIRIKRSNVAGNKPTTSNIELGELALNTKDQKLYSSNGSVIFEMANASALANTNSGISNLNTNLTSTNTALRTLISDRIQVANVVAEYQPLLLARGQLNFYDSDSSNYVAFRAPTAVTTDYVWTLPSADGTSGQFLKTDGAGNLSFAAAGSGGGASGFQDSTISTAPGASGDFDLSFNSAQTIQETPFETTGTDAFGVSLGAVYTCMEPVGSIITVDYGDGEDYVGA